MKDKMKLMSEVINFLIVISLAVLMSSCGTVYSRVTTEGATVLQDGQVKGKSPITLALEDTLGFQRIVISAEKEGYEPAQIELSEHFGRSEPDEWLPSSIHLNLKQISTEKSHAMAILPKQIISNIKKDFPTEKPHTAVAPLAILGPINEAEKQVVFNMFQDKLSEYYDLVSQEQFNEAQVAAFESLEVEECTEEQ